ncbi:MAG TPA: hypothetical protein VNM91_03790 [Dehalococcoidia bacterium]|nr:hypothetical protein [Dehalococcoidia bacterium]
MSIAFWTVIGIGMAIAGIGAVRDTMRLWREHRTRNIIERRLRRL